MRHWFRRDVQVRHLGDLRRIFDRPTGRVFDVDRRAVPTVDALLGRGDREPDPEILAALENRVLIAPEFTRRETLQVTGAAAGLITSFVLPSASAAASTGGLSFSSASDNGTVTSTVVEDGGAPFDLYEIKFSLTGLSDNSTITRTLTIAEDTLMTMILVGGGGGGGSFANPANPGYGGGGGAGEVVVLANHTISAGAYIVSVGAGGDGGFHSAGSKGVGSSVRLDGAGSDLLFADGGGGGGGYNGAPTSGGSGGGRADTDATATRVAAGGNGVAPASDGTSTAVFEEEAGGLSATSAGGGGGGAGQVGGNASSSTGGDGGGGYDASGYVMSALSLAIGGGGSGTTTGGTGRGTANNWGRGGFITGGTYVPAEPGLNGTGDGGGGGLRGPAGSSDARRGATGVLFIRTPRI